MFRFVAGRLVALFATLVAVSIIIFVMVRLLPGSILDLFFAGDNTATPEQLEEAKKKLGLTGSYFEQYWNWISGVVHGDFGHSLLTGQPVTEIMRTSLPIDIELVFLGLLIALSIGIPLGVLSAVRRDSATDYFSRDHRPDRHQHPELLARDAAADLHVARLPLGAAARVRPVPRGPVAEHPGVLPAGDRDLRLHARDRDAHGARDDARGAEPRLRAHGARQGRAAPDACVRKHALRNALIPVVTVAGFEIGALISGAAIAEIIFGLPGVGYQLLHAIFQRDYPVVQAATLIIAATFVIANFLVDIVYGLLDPRIAIR